MFTMSKKHYLYMNLDDEDARALKPHTGTAVVQTMRCVDGTFDCFITPESDEDLLRFVRALEDLKWYDKMVEIGREPNGPIAEKMILHHARLFMELNGFSSEGDDDDIEAQMASLSVGERAFVRVEQGNVHIHYRCIYGRFPMCSGVSVATARAWVELTSARSENGAFYDVKWDTGCVVCTTFQQILNVLPHN